MSYKTNQEDSDKNKRVSRKKLHRQVLVVSKSTHLQEIIKHTPGLILVLNSNFQIIHANNFFLDYLNLMSPSQIIGFRFGEIMSCPNAMESEGGCGTSDKCKVCGLCKGLNNSIKQNSITVEDCDLEINTGLERETLELRMWANPITLEDSTYIICSFIDVSDARRRRTLEEIFFHDILNNAHALQSAVEILKMQDSESMGRGAELILKHTKQVIEIIESQRDLIAAENDELKVKPVKINISEFLESMVETSLDLKAAFEKNVDLRPSLEPLSFESDKTLVGRVILNMLKNALEASQPGDTVEAGWNNHATGVEFWVKNKAFIPPEVQFQLFKRSFSTKGKGRGLGAYGMKLLSERYLNGQVDFSTSPDTGTIFMARFPLKWSKSWAEKERTERPFEKIMG